MLNSTTIKDLQNIKNQQGAVEEFKKPLKFVGKKKKPIILTEEKYIEEMSRIIQRDFFPDLDKLRAQNEYLNAVEKKDYAQIQAIRAKYSGRKPSERSRSMTPATFETPASAVINTPNCNDGSDTPKSTITITSEMAASEGSQKSISDKHSLDSFLSAYTSEDNQSFQEIIDTAQEKLRQKFMVLFNEEDLSAERLALALAIPCIEDQFKEPDPMRKIETWGYKAMNSIMYVPDGVELTQKEKIEAAKLKQSIQHSATRLVTNPFNDCCSQKEVSEIAKSQSQALSGKIGVDGNAFVPTVNGVPQIRGFDLVQTPSPRPGEAFSPLMTWGEIEGTPFRLDGSDTPLRSHTGPSFKIAENSRRENIALQLAEKVGEKIRAQKQRAMDTARKNINSPFIRSNIDRLASMSPAARRLATTKLGLRTPLMTPSPMRTPTRSNIQMGKSRHMNKSVTPLVRKTPSAPGTPKNSNSEKSSITDDLLQIPQSSQKRLRAADFF